jgi:pyruvate/2-oxoglutarate dehydrogenase complex dihydrolipoamide acyltransferase (E2) component
MRSRTIPLLTLLAVLALPIGAAGATPPADEPCTTDDLASVTYLVGDEGREVSDLRGNVIAGEQVEVQFTTHRPCTFSLAAFQVPSATYVPEEVDDQVLVSEDTIVDAEPGRDHVLFVDVPDCYFQVDFAVGGVQVPPTYGDALVSADNGGSHPCAAATPTPTPSATPSPSASPTASPTPTPPASPTATPSPTATATPAPTASEAASPAATATPVASPAASPSASATPVAVVAAQGGGTGGALASTGLSTGPLVALGALALVGGSALLWVTQRRRGGTV